MWICPVGWIPEKTTGFAAAGEVDMKRADSCAAAAPSSRLVPLIGASRGSGAAGTSAAAAPSSAARRRAGARCRAADRRRARCPGGDVDLVGRIGAVVLHAPAGVG